MVLEKSKDLKQLKSDVSTAKTDEKKQLLCGKFVEKYKSHNIGDVIPSKNGYIVVGSFGIQLSDSSIKPSYIVYHGSKCRQNGRIFKNTDKKDMYLEYI